MEILLDFIKICIPAAAVALTAWFTIQSVHKKELKKEVLNLKFNSKQVITPIRLQAYERIALLLERIKPDSLLLRNQGNLLNAHQYRNILLSSIRSEFEHNLSQQVYVSSAVWEAVRNAKERTVQIINLAAGKLDPSAQGSELANKILEINMQNNPQPSDEALAVLKQEIKELY